MKIALDAQLAIGTATGIGEYVRGLGAALRADGVEVVELAEARLDPWRFDRRVRWDQFVLPHRARRSGADVLHCASGTMPLALQLPTVVTVHDVAWLKVQTHARPYARWYFGAFSLRRYAHAQRIVVDSEFSRRELLDVLDVPPYRVDVVYPGVSDDFCSLRRQLAGDGVILVPGTVERRKNLEVLIRALPALPDARIVSVGPPTPYRAQCEQLASELRVADRLQFRGYVAREELLQLYATCAVVAVPSRYEGFGYAAAQALCAGAPAIVSDRSSLPEIAAADLPVVEVDDVEAWTAALRGALESSLPQERANAARSRAMARFAWPASAQKMRGVYSKTYSR